MKIVVPMLVVLLTTASALAGPKGTVRIHGGLILNNQNDLNMIIQEANTTSDYLNRGNLNLPESNYSLIGSGYVVYGRISNMLSFGGRFDYILRSILADDQEVFKVTTKTSAAIPSLIAIADFMSSREDSFFSPYVGAGPSVTIAKGQYSIWNYYEKDASKIMFSGMQLGAIWFIGSDMKVFPNVRLNLELGYRYSPIYYVQVDSSEGKVFRNIGVSSDSTVSNRLGIEKGTIIEPFTLSFSGPFFNFGFTVYF